ncbi:hypothetical protein I3842_09G209900 [Carya illinoinensis]|uniref:Uncharacterized protein n=1 Tax=Carya illinoinensis TaxID=32201 RepID=A0A922JAG0_CARIL|nr:hypothetical protein I3842_09G209900 [Carya illinoinensis]
MWSMMIYLTEIWNLDIILSAAIINGFNGVENIMPIGMAFFVDAFMGEYWMLLLSSLAYSCGLGILAILHIILSKSERNSCPANMRPGCISDLQKFLFFMALTLKALGVCGHTASLSSFLGRQSQNQTPTDKDDDQIKRKRPGKFGRILGRCVIVLLAILAIILLSFMPWAVNFGIPAIGMVVATLLFVSGTSSYKHAAPQVGLLTTVLRGFCDKGVVIVQIQTPDEKAEHVGLKLPKIFARMIPWWIIFIMCGVVSSIGDTYFLEQANNMQKGKVGGSKVPSFILLLFHNITKFVFSKLIAVVAKKLYGKGFGKSIFPIGVIAAMFFSVVCCVVAANVETRRLELSNELENSNTEIPMSMFWLLPQYFFLAAIDGISDYLCGDLEKVSGYSIACFCIAPKYSSSVSTYLRLCTNAAFGLGTVGSSISVQVADKFSEIGRNSTSSWFQETLNGSHLDYYYLTLAALSSINLVLCILVSIWYIHQHHKAMIGEMFTTPAIVKMLFGMIFSFHIFSLN